MRVTRAEILEEFVNAAKLGRRRDREYFDQAGFTFIAPSLDPVEAWRRSVHAFVGALVVRHKLKSKWKEK